MDLFVIKLNNFFYSDILVNDLLFERVEQVLERVYHKVHSDTGKNDDF